MTTSVLELKYVEPTRPYSQNELAYMRTRLRRLYRLGDSRVYHRRCGHIYLVKENGRKEKEMREQEDTDVGNCSVCWKITKTPHHLRNSARNLVLEYGEIFNKDPEYLNYDTVELENALYTWLYLDFN
jgi:hypothetical protein